MKSTLYVCSIALAAALAGASCSTSSSPTAMDDVSTTLAPSHASGSTYHGARGTTPSASTATHSSSLSSRYREAGISGASDVVEEFNCTHVQEVFVRFSQPGYVLDNAVGLYVSYTGLPAGRKLLRVWWDYEGTPGAYQDFHVGEGEVQRDDDSLFDHESVVEHAYAGVGGPTEYRVRAEMILVGKTGNCARVRNVTVTPGDREVQSVAGPIVNGSFETGDFSGWTVQDLSGPFYPASVVAAGTSPGFGLFASAPTDGGFAAVNGFDGNGPGTISLMQTITVDTASDVLRFDYRAGWDMVTFGGSTMDRVFAVQIESTGGAVLATQTILTATAATQNLDTGNLSGSVSLAPFAGSTIQIRFLWTIPQNLTGPAFFQLDNVRISP
jgi:hypothetical protein